MLVQLTVRDPGAGRHPGGRALLVAAALLAVAAAGPATASERPPALQVEPTTPEPGSTLAVTGSGFTLPPVRTCEVVALGRAWTCRLGAQGAQATLLLAEVDGVAAGTHRVEVCAPSCQDPWGGSAQGTLTVVVDGASTGPDERSDRPTDEPDPRVTATPSGPPVTTPPSTGPPGTEPVRPPVTATPTPEPETPERETPEPETPEPRTPGTGPVVTDPPVPPTTGPPPTVGTPPGPDRDAFGNIVTPPAEQRTDPPPGTGPVVPRTAGVPGQDTGDVAAPRLRLVAQSADLVDLVPRRARATDRVEVTAAEVPSPSGTGPCVLTWDGTPAGQCSSDGAGVLSGSLQVPGSARAGSHELAACRPTCAAPRGGTATATVVVAAAAAGPTTSTADAGTTDGRTWLLLLLLALLALLVGAVASVLRSRRLRAGRLLHVEPVPDLEPDVRTVVEVPAQRMPPLRLLVRPDERPVVSTEVTHDDAR